MIRLNELGLRDCMYQETGSEAILFDDKFIYDSVGNIKEIQHIDGSKKVYEYDLSNRLVREKEINLSTIRQTSLLPLMVRV